jgi:hypothetical protein
MKSDMVAMVGPRDNHGLAMEYGDLHYRIAVVHFILGVGLLVAPAVLGYVGVMPAAVSNGLSGVLLILMAISSVLVLRPNERLVQAMVGAWLVVSPFVGGFSDLTAPMAASTAIGAVVAIFAVAELVLMSMAAPSRRR